MKISYFLIPALCCLVVSTASAQNGRTFDNFDRSQGVQILLPPPPVAKPMAKTVAKNSRKKRGSKWEVAVEDKPVKKTGQTRMTVNVTDGLATRETPFSAGGTKLAMGSSSNL